MAETPQDLLRKVFGDEGPAEPERPRNQTPLFRLSTTLPEFTAETRRVLLRCGETALADQLDELWIYDRCRCGMKECATICTADGAVEAVGTGQLSRSCPAQKSKNFVSNGANHSATLRGSFRPKKPKRKRLGRAAPTARSVPSVAWGRHRSAKAGPLLRSLGGWWEPPSRLRLPSRSRTPGHPTAFPPLSGAAYRAEVPR